MYATARDWATFGLLYLQNGVWNGEAILPSWWVSYSSKPTPTEPKGRYGAHFWTNGGDAVPEKRRPMPSLPGDTFYAMGYEGQYVMIVPSRKLVVVRLGQTKKSWDVEGFVSEVLDSIHCPQLR